MLNISAEDKLMLAVVRVQPTAEHTEQINALLPEIKHWEATVRLLTRHGSAPLFFVQLPALANASLLPASVRNVLQQTYYKSLTRGMLLYNVFSEVVDALKGIEIIVLKGAYLSEHLYKDIALRQFSDLDLLVHPYDGEKALAALSAIGFKPRASKPVSEFVEKNSDFVHYQPMERGDVSVEIHIKLHGRSPDYKLNVEDIWHRSVDEIINKKPVKVMCTSDLLMHLCIHAEKHVKEGEIQMKSYNDLVNLLLSLPPDFDWLAFENCCIKYRCAKVVFKQLYLTAGFYNIAFPEFLKLAYPLSLSDKEQFLSFLHCESFKAEKKSTTAVPGHVNSLRNIKSPRIFLIYIKEVLFPSKSFMISKYGLVSSSELRVQSKNMRVSKLKTQNSKLQTENPKLKFWWLWYPYRWFVGAKGVVKMVWKKR